MSTKKTRILGAIYAGGKASRFEGDKVNALFHDKPLIRHVIERLEPQVEKMIALGGVARHDIVTIADRPAPNMGPIGGLNAALNYAMDNLYHWVITVPCDMPYLPGDIARSLIDEADKVDAPCAMVAHDLQSYPIVAVWKPVLATMLDTWLEHGEARALHRFFANCKGVRHYINDKRLLTNINRRTDLEENMGG
jgi:molybdenum cofactor guanylyltransferase